MAPQLAQPWYFNKPSDIALGQENEVYLSDTGNHRIQVLHHDGTYLRSFGSFGTAPGQLNEPGGIAVYADEVLVADSRNHRIQVFNHSSGAFLRGWGQPGTAAGQFNLPYGVAVNAQGHVYCVDSLNHRVQVFTRLGELLGSFGEQGTANGQFYTPQGIAISARGEVYVVDSGNHRVQVFDSQGQFLRSWGSKGSLPGLFNRPYGISIGRDERIRVADAANNRIQVFDRNGQFLQSIGKPGSSQGQLFSPYGMLEGPTGNLLVVDTRNHRVQVFASNGEFLQQWGSFAEVPGAFNGPYHAAFNQNNELFVADTLNQRVQVFAKDGTWLRSWGKQGVAAGEFQWPSGIAFTQAGEVLVVDSGNHRVQVFSAQGTFLRSWGSFGSTPGKFYYPKSVAVSADNKVLVTDSSNYRVQVFDVNGTLISSWGRQGKERGQFEAPYGIAVSKQNEVYVTDPWNYRIQVFDLSGQFLRSWGSYGSKAGQLNRPYNLSISDSNQVYVSDTYNHRIQVFTPEGQPLLSLGEFGSAPGQFNFPAAVALDNAGNVLVVDQNNHRVQWFKRSVSQNEQHPFKAILLAGGGPSQGNYLNHIWDATQLLANKAHAALRAQGFAKDEIKYLSAGSTQIDLDNNGLFDDLTAANLSTLQQAISTWASDAQEVFVYLIDHGGDGRFQVNDHEILTAAQLNDWLDQLQARVPGRITVVIEACRSGSFISQLSKRKRQIMTSADAQQAAIIGNKGLNSFSYYFWNEIRSGAVLRDAFRTARQGMSTQIVETRAQNAQLDSDGDKQFASADFEVLGDYCLGNCLQFAANSPTLSKVTPDAVLQGESKLSFSVAVNSLETLNSAWVVITPPDFKHSDSEEPVSDLPKIYLQCDNLGNCTGEYDQFSTPGTYTLNYYAVDSKYQPSLPVQRSVVQKGAGGASNGARYDAGSQLLQLADVQIGAAHYAVTLQHLGKQLFSVTQLTQLTTTNSSNAVASFDAASQVLRIPALQVATQVYPTALTYSGNLQFTWVGVMP